MKLNIFAGIAIAGFCTLYATTAMAEDDQKKVSDNRIAVMKLDSAGGNSQAQADMVLESIRNEVMKSAYSLDANGSDITYMEMQMVTGCDSEEDLVTCYAATCNALGASNIIFGSVDENGEVILIWYEVTKGIKNNISGKVTDQASSDKLARRIVIGVGDLTITSNIADADVYIDTNLVGKTSGSGLEDELATFSMELPIGNHSVYLDKAGYNQPLASVDIQDNKVSEVTLNMVVTTDPAVFQKAFKIAGWTTFGVGFAALVAGGVMAYEVHSWQNDLSDAIFVRKDGKEATDINNKGKKGAIAVDVLFGVGGFLAATGVALVCVGYLYDFTGESTSVISQKDSYMPKVDLQLSPEYQGMTMGWTF